MGTDGVRSYTGAPAYESLDRRAEGVSFRDSVYRDQARR